MNEFIPMVLTLIGLIAVLIALIMLLNEREMDEQFPETRKREKARLMSEEYRK